jgi:hypothetical protein
MATTKNQAVRMGRKISSSEGFFELRVDGLLVEELENKVPIKIDSLENENGEFLKREE